jgi:hypothetical protein
MEDNMSPKLLPDYEISDRRNKGPRQKMERAVLNLLVTPLNREAGTGLRKSLNHAAEDDGESPSNSLLDFFFDHEVGRTMFLRNVG